MRADPVVHYVLNDEGLTRGLGDAEARVLIEWLVERAEAMATTMPPGHAAEEVRRLCRRGRALSKFVALWCGPRGRGAATQLAATERFAWPLPDDEADPCELMLDIVGWESRQLANGTRSGTAA